MMKKYLVVFGFAFLMFGLAFSAHATSFDFLGSAEGGTASATVDFLGSGTDVFTIRIDNTSPTSLNDGTVWANAPAITGVGFNINPNVNVSSWSLTAQDSSGTTLSIDDNSGSTGDWILGVDASVGNIVLDLYANNDTGGKAGLYNPATLDAPSNTITWGGPPQYFTTAVLTINFEGQTESVEDSPELMEDSPFIRWQNVGRDGEGSLKTSIPDAASVFLLGSACLVGFVGLRRKPKK